QQRGFRHRRVVDKGAAGGAQVLDQHPRAGDAKFTMRGRHGLVVNGNEQLGIAAQDRGAAWEPDVPCLVRAGIDNQLEHGCPLFVQAGMDCQRYFEVWLATKSMRRPRATKTTPARRSSQTPKPWCARRCCPTTPDQAPT